MKKVFRKHNASSLHDAYAKEVHNKYDTNRVFYVWTNQPAKATIFTNEYLAKLALDELINGAQNNYSYTYSIIDA